MKKECLAARPSQDSYCIESSRNKTVNAMEMKTKSLKQNYNPKLKASLVLSFEFCLFHFVLLVFCSSVAVAGEKIPPEQFDPTNFLENVFAETLQDANTLSVPGGPETISHVWEPPVRVAGPQQKRQEQPQTNGGVAVNIDMAQGDKKFQQSGFVYVKDPNSRFLYRLWQTRIATPGAKEDKKSKKELKQIIEQIHSVEFEAKEQPPQPVIVVEPAPKTEPGEVLSFAEVPVEVIEESEEKQAEPKPETPFYDESQKGTPLPYEPVTRQTLQTLEDLSQHLDHLDNPLELGEVLFLSGNLKEAVAVYQTALACKRADDVSSAQDKAWILFQIGNCLRDDNLPMAMEAYRQLITEYPDSLWTDLAKARHKFIDWYQKDKPRMLIDEYGPQKFRSEMEHAVSE